MFKSMSSLSLSDNSAQQCGQRTLANFNEMSNDPQTLVWNTSGRYGSSHRKPKCISNRMQSYSVPSLFRLFYIILCSHLLRSQPKALTCMSVLLVLLAHNAINCFSTTEESSTQINDVWTWNLDSVTPSNISLSMFHFENESNIDLNQITIVSKDDTVEQDSQRLSKQQVFVGAVNTVYRFTFAPYYGFELKQQVPFGPFPRQSMCPYPNDQNTDDLNKFDNIIKVMFNFKGSLFVCGSELCGQCRVFRANDLEKNRMFGNDQPDDPMNLIGGRRSSIAFFGKLYNNLTLYVGHSYDYRSVDTIPPFISSRSITMKGFVYSKNEINHKSFVSIHPKYIKSNPVRFVYGFSYNGFAYFVTVQPMEPTSFEYETKLSRVCENDPNPFFSYVEIPLECRHHSRLYPNAKTATLEVKLSKKENLLYQTKDGNQAKLFVTFDSFENSVNESVVCSFSMDDVERHFIQMASDCSTLHHKTELLEKIHGKKLLCLSFEDPIDAKGISCGDNPPNRYINGKDPLQGALRFAVTNDRISSIGVVEVHDPFSWRKNTRTLMMLGTEKSRLLKIQLSDTEDTPDIKFMTQLSSIGPILPHMSFDPLSASFYLLSKRSLIHFPIDSCSVYSTCQACFKANENCYWFDSRCYLLKEIERLEMLPEILPECKPIVYDFEPKMGPSNGGTNITFYGSDFGWPHTSKFNSNVSITIGGYECLVFERTNNLIRCRVQQISNIDTEDFSGVINFSLFDLMDISVRKYAINGSLTLPHRFHFQKPTIKGIHPPYGPYIGGTMVLIFGQHLAMGTQTKVMFDTSNCELIASGERYIICKTESKNMVSDVTNVAQISTQVTVTIDYFHMVLNSENLVRVDKPEEIFNSEMDDHHLNHDANFVHKREVDSQVELNQSEAAVKQFERLFDWSQGPLYFFDCFVYKPNPVVSEVKNLNTITSGHTMVEFYGYHLSSVYYPSLEVIFEHDATVTQKLISLTTFCKLFIDNDTPNEDGDETQETTTTMTTTTTMEYQMDEHKLLCSLPPLSDNSDILLPNKDFYITARFVLHLDGVTLDSLNVPPTFKSGHSKVTYHPDPVFFTNNDDNSLQSVSTANRTVVLIGNHLHPKLPYEILVDGKYECQPLLVDSGQVVFERLHCVVNITAEQMQDLLYQPLNLTVHIGLHYYNMGQIQFADFAEAISVVKAIYISLFMLVLLCLFGLYLFFRKSTHQVQKYTSVQMCDITPKTLRSVLMPHDATLYDNLEALNLVLNPEEVEIGEMLGEGNYGVVYKGLWGDKEVAIKKPQASGGNSIVDFSSKLFIREINTMKDFRHKHVLSLMGVTLLDNELHILMPFMHEGDLHNYIKDPKRKTLMWKELIHFCIQVAEGMNYLASKKFVHRDLAARNCLIDKNMVVKVADFGLTRKMFYDCYDIKSSINLPIRWTAIESLEESICTVKSDVWSFGVLMWELFTRGNVPYADLESPEMLKQYLHRGERLKCPPRCHPLFYDIMTECWRANPDERPNFDVLLRRLLLIRDNALGTGFSLPKYENSECFNRTTEQSKMDELQGIGSSRGTLRHNSRQTQPIPFPGTSNRILPVPTAPMATVPKSDLDSRLEEDVDITSPPPSYTAATLMSAIGDQADYETCLPAEHPGHRWSINVVPNGIHNTIQQTPIDTITNNHNIEEDDDDANQDEYFAPLEKLSHLQMSK